MSLVADVRPRLVSAHVKLRKEVTHLAPGELAAYRGAVQAMQARRDDRGWQFFAGWHGVPRHWCKHGSKLFLPWHRSYLYHLELALQDHDPDVTIPWWNWMTKAGIPSPFEAGDAAGNPLAGGPIEPFGVPHQPEWPTETSREPFDGTGPGPVPPPLRAARWLMEPTDFVEFSRRCEVLHNNIHGWVGGTMGQIDWAAYDPLFFSHHSMVDRLWRIWQYRNPGAGPPASLLDVSLPAANRPIFTVREVLDVQLLGYDYSASSSSVSGTI